MPRKLRRRSRLNGEAILLSQPEKETRIIQKKKVLISWVWVASCSAAIFATVPVGRSIQKFVYNNWGREAFIYFVLGVLAAVILVVLYFLIIKFKTKSSSNYIWLIVIGTLYIYFTLKLRNIPEEAVHFLEYGLLGFFLFKALSHHVKDKSVYLSATLFALLIGTFDEILQWMIPQRYWDFRDAGLNGLSGGLFQLAIWKVISPKTISEKVNPNSIKIFSSILGACLMLLGLCASNNPRRVANYTKLMPWLSFLQKEEPMSEFGYKYKDSEIGIFYSRFSPENLRKEDNMKNEQYARILDESKNMDYEQFLKEYNPINNPFLHELRIHIFRRNTYYEKGNSYFIAYKENLILQKYFTQTLQRSIFKWDENKIKEIGDSIDKSKFYESPVSASLFTNFTEKSMWIAIFTLLFLLMLLNLGWRFRKRH